MVKPPAKPKDRQLYVEGDCPRPRGVRGVALSKSSLPLSAVHHHPEGKPSSPPPTMNTAVIGRGVLDTAMIEVAAQFLRKEATG